MKLFPRPVRVAACAGVALAGVLTMGACAPNEHSINSIFGGAAPQAFAIAQCESGMNPGAVSRTNDHGLFQINAVHRGNFERVTGHGWEHVYSPWFNTVYAKHLYDTQGWGPWSCRYVL